MRQRSLSKEADVSREIEKAIADDDWEAARLLIQSALEEQPENHWLLTRLALTYYEQFDYQRALELSCQALAIESECPLALWDYAGALEMLDRPEEALTFYQRIIDRGIDSLAYDQCGEGRARARGLSADSHYRMSHCYLALGDKDKAVEMMRLHLQQRGPGCQSIYPIAGVRKEMLALEA
jgi:tetratricopeptide (TPR) repeat protein